MRVIDSPLIANDRRPGNAVPFVVVVRGHGQEVAVFRTGGSPVDEEGLLDLRSIDGHGTDRVVGNEARAAGVLVPVRADYFPDRPPDTPIAVNLVAERVEAFHTFWWIPASSRQ